MIKHFSKILMLLMVVANFSFAGDDHLEFNGVDPSKSKGSIQQVTDLCRNICELGSALDALHNNDYSASLFLNSTHFLVGVAGSYQAFKEWFPMWMDPETAELAAPVASVLFSSARMFWASDQPISSIPMTSILGGLAWGYKS